MSSKQQGCGEIKGYGLVIPFGSILKWLISPIEECLGDVWITESETDAFRSSSFGCYTE